MHNRFRQLCNEYIGEEIMPAIDNLNQAVQDVQAENAVVIGALNTVSGQLAALAAQVTALQASLASGNNDVAIQAAADALEAGVATVQSTVASVLPSGS